jgi:hypothetical protein
MEFLRDFHALEVCRAHVVLGAGRETIFFNIFYKIHVLSHIIILDIHMAVEPGNLIRLPGAYAPSIIKSYFKVLKKFNKKFNMYISIIYVYSSSFMKK